MKKRLVSLLVTLLICAMLIVSLVGCSGGKAESYEAYVVGKRVVTVDVAASGVFVPKGVPVPVLAYLTGATVEETRGVVVNTPYLVGQNVELKKKNNAPNLPVEYYSYAVICVILKDTVKKSASLQADLLEIAQLIKENKCFKEGVNEDDIVISDKIESLVENFEKIDLEKFYELVLNEVLVSGKTAGYYFSLPITTTTGSLMTIVSVGEEMEGIKVVSTILNVFDYGVDALIDQLDVSKIVAGQKVIVSPSAITNNDVNGVVEFISTVGEQIGGVVMFRAKIAIDNNQSTALKDIRVGMTASCNIAIKSSNEAVIAVPVDGVVYTPAGKAAVIKKEYASSGQSDSIDLKYGKKLTQDEYNQVKNYIVEFEHNKELIGDSYMCVISGINEGDTFVRFRNRSSFPSLF